eukprot:SAG31_NODE_122_length_23797_cov_39.343812_23_plen_36_part_00
MHHCSIDYARPLEDQRMIRRTGLVPAKQVQQVKRK